jgi:hypothetical protein
MKLNKKSSDPSTEPSPIIIKPDEGASASEDGIIIEEVKEEAQESGEPRKKYDPKRQEFVMMYVIQKGAAV